MMHPHNRIRHGVGRPVSTPPTEPARIAGHGKRTVLGLVAAIVRDPRIKEVGVLNLDEVKRELGVASGGRVIAPLIVGEPRGPTPVVPRRQPRVLAWLR